MDTIFALATAPGKAGLAVVRISGPEALAAAERMSGRLPVKGRSLRKLRGAEGHLIDEALILTFEEGQSFTGDCVVELHLHGSTAVVASIQKELAAQPGLRLAEPGEFTRRAFEAGRLDLSQVEGLADLIESETEAQRKAAMRQMTGGVRALADGWRAKLVRAAALIEATIDFADEEVPTEVRHEVAGLIDSVLPELQREVAGFGAAERLRAGFEVVILGRPNAGKSTLLNAIAGREAAITSSVAGTTRDLIEVRVDLGGLPVTLVDTAGLRDTEDEVEKIGVGRALDRARGADLRIVLLESDEDTTYGTVEAQDIRVVSKGDLNGAGSLPRISGKTGAGIRALLDTVRERLADKVAGAGEINRDRHLAAVSRAIGALESARNGLWAETYQPELVAEALRDALRALDRLIGRVDVEAILGEIFSSFCIGK